MKIIKRVNLNEKYKAKNGKEYTQVNYYIELDNGSWVAIRPIFSEGYDKLDAVAQRVVNGSIDNDNK